MFFMLDLDVLPHEFLAKIAAGESVKIKNVLYRRDDFGDVIEKIEEIEEVYPSLEQRIDCAKAAAPYFATKLNTQLSDNANCVAKINNLFSDLADKLP